MASRVTLRGIGVLLYTIVSVNAFAQFSVQHQSPIAIERNEPTPLDFTTPGINQSDVQQARLFYRYDGDFSYQQQEIPFQNGSFSTFFTVRNPSASTLEYYLEITLVSGDRVYYPVSQPEESPITVEVVNPSVSQEEQLEGVDYNILSPRPQDGLAEDDIVIAIALFYDPRDLEPGEFRLLLDQIDVTQQADTSAYYISYIPESVSRGPHQVELQYKTPDKTYTVTRWQFFVVDPEEATFQGFTESSKPVINVELSARNQVIAGDVNNAYTGRTRISGSQGPWRYMVTGYLTSQESARLQPQNRYELDLKYGEKFELEAGHVYPYLTEFTISGRRLLGINSSVHLWDDRLNLQIMHGSLDRDITNRYDSLIVEDITNSADSVVGKNYFLSYQDNGRGTFKRRITAGRVGFGDEDKFQFGLHMMRIQDDTTSIFNIRNYTDLANSNFTIDNNLDAAEFDSLAVNPDLLQVQGGNIKPRANLVVGSDLKMSFMNNRLRFRSEAALSVLNNDIYGGPLTVERAEDLGFDIDQGVSDLLKQLSWLIVINENMNTFPVNISESDSGDLVAAPFFPTSILAGSGELSYRYASNNARIQYRWIGPDYSSLANSTIRRDIAGFTLSDRMNLLSNRLYLTLGYENLQDNVTGSQDATTRTQTIRTNASWYPLTSKLPRVSVGLRYRSRDNGIERQNYLLSEDRVKAAVQNIRQELQVINGQDSLVTLVTPNPKRSHTYNLNTSVTQQFDFLNARNDASVSISNIRTEDEVFAFGDVNSSAVSFNLTTRFYDAPYETQAGFTYNNTEVGNGLSKVKIAGFYAGGDLKLLDDRLNINGQVALTFNRTELRSIEVRDNEVTTELNTDPKDNYYVLGETVTGDKFQTYVFQTGARFTIDEYQSILFDANFTNVSGEGSANDRIIQLRYLFSF